MAMREAIVAGRAGWPVLSRSEGRGSGDAEKCNNRAVQSSPRLCRPEIYAPNMPWGLRRYQQTRQLHFVTFTCYHRKPFLADPRMCDQFEQTLETVRRWYGFWISGYVIMPEHVHLLVSEPERKNLALALQMLKQMVSRNRAGWPVQHSKIASAA